MSHLLLEYVCVLMLIFHVLSEASSAVCSVKAQNDVVPGEVCITLNQTQELVTNPVGSWALLPGRAV